MAKESLNFKFRCKVGYVKKDENGTVMSLSLASQDVETLMLECAKKFRGYNQINVSDEHAPNSIYVKSQFDIPVINTNKEKIDCEVFSGADITARIAIKPYEYMKKKGLTAYIQAILLHKNGDDYHTETDSNYGFDDDDFIAF